MCKENNKEKKSMATLAKSREYIVPKKDDDFRKKEAASYARFKEIVNSKSSSNDFNAINKFLNDKNSR